MKMYWFETVEFFKDFLKFNCLKIKSEKAKGHSYDHGDHGSPHGDGGGGGGGHGHNLGHSHEGGCHTHHGSHKEEKEGHTKDDHLVLEADTHHHECSKTKGSISKIVEDMEHCVKSHFDLKSILKIDDNCKIVAMHDEALLEFKDIFRKLEKVTGVGMKKNSNLGFCRAKSVMFKNDQNNYSEDDSSHGNDSELKDEPFAVVK